MLPPQPAPVTENSGEAVEQTFSHTILDIDMVKIKLVNQQAKIPTRGSEGAAGYDLYSTQEGTLGPFERVCISTGVCMEIPAGCYGKVSPIRHGTATRHCSAGWYH